MKLLRSMRPEPFVLLMTAAWIVGLFSAATAPLQDLWRPLLIGLLMAAAVTAVAGVLRSADRWAVVVAGIGWLVVLGAWPLALAVLLVAAWRLVLDWLRHQQGRAVVREPADRQVLRLTNALGFAAVIVAAFSLVNSGAIRFGSTAPATESLPDGQWPSMYLVLLDGYPATETLADTFGFDNSPFEDALMDRGFGVAEAPSSNYNRTLLTLVSMMYGQPIEDIDALAPPRDGFSAQTRQLTAALNDAPIPRMLRDAGYETRWIASSYGEAVMTNSDQVVSGGAMTLFEEQLVRYSAVGRSLLGLVPGVIAQQHRTSVQDSLEGLAGAGTASNDPQLVLAHVFSPHPPFVFAADGSSRPLLRCYPQACGMTTPEAGRVGIDLETYGDGLIGQVEWLNGRLLDAVDAIVEADPNAVIVLFSDHGARFDEGPTAEHFQTFLAARTPGQDGLLTDGPITLVNVMPMLLDRYLGADLPMADDHRAWASDDAPLELEQVP